MVRIISTRSLNLECWDSLDREVDGVVYDDKPEHSSSSCLFTRTEIVYPSAEPVEGGLEIQELNLED